MAFILYYTASGTELISLSQAVNKLIKEGIDLKIVVRSAMDIFDSRQEERLINMAVEAEALVLVPHGGQESLPGVDKIISSAKKAKIVHVQPIGGSDDDLALVDKFAYPKDESFFRRILYLKYGGPENLKNFLLDLYSAITGKALQISPPKPLLTEGIYHPEGRVFEDVSEYFAWLESRGMKSCVIPKPVIGIWFYQGYWVNNDLEPVDALVQEIEALGGIALPVFHRRFVEEGEKALRPTQVAEKFFKQDGKTIVHTLINLQPFSQNLLWPETKEIYPSLGVPVLQGIMSFSPRLVWEKENYGLSPMELCISVAQPEIDGCIITIPIATREELEIDPLLGTRIRKYLPISERVSKIARMALNWARLKLTPPSQRRVAIIFHHYPPRSDRLGCAFGLDSFESVARLLKELAKHGYRVDYLYESGEELAQKLLSVHISDQYYLSTEIMADRAVAKVSKEKVKEWHISRPVSVRKALEKSWGDPPGKLFVHKEKLLIGGIYNGNIFISLQPPRGDHEKLSQENIHDPNLPPTHHYLAFYKWLKKEFQAHVVVHVGKHGSLEWLPGKAVALSENCYPDQAIEDLPNIYPYIVNDPGEGTQAKRRSYCVIIDHMIPPQKLAGRYGELSELSEMLSEWQILIKEHPTQADNLARQIIEKALSVNIHEDLSLNKEEIQKKPEAFLEKLHDYLEEIANTYVNDGLHILGHPPQGKQREETLSAMSKGSGRPVKELEPLLEGIRDEMRFLLDALEGGFVPPGPSGAPTRGAIEVLPTGRNFYSVDPLKIPTKVAWERGIKQAQALLERHLKDYGTYPKTLAMIIWGSPTMRTRGEDFACALYLLGVRPIWHPKNKRVLGVEVIPLSELGRPRIDVTLRTSGFFRDAFRNLMELFDEAVQMIAQLDENPEENFLASNFKEDLKKLVSQGIPYEEAYRKATFRVFSDPPGAYGAGVNQMLDTGKWEDHKDLAKVYIEWGGYAYGKKVYGQDAREVFRKVLSRVEVTYKNEDTREIDILSCDCFNAYHGGLNVTVEALSGKQPISYSTSTNDPDHPVIRTTAEEMRFLFRIKVLNPRWIEGMKRHGYKGAGDLSRIVDLCYHWDATSNVLSDWMYEKLAQTYALSEEMQEFFKKHNPAALLNIAERLFEAAKRGLWKNPDYQTLESLKKIILEMEEEIV